MRPPEAAPPAAAGESCGGGARGGAPAGALRAEPRGPPRPAARRGPSPRPPPPPLLGTPTLHSSLGGLGAPPTPDDFDAPRAAAALLGSSFAARCALEAAAAGAINVPPAQRLFHDLVSLAVPPPRGLLRRAPPRCPHKAPGPDAGVLAGGPAGDRGALAAPRPPRPPRPFLAPRRHLRDVPQAAAVGALRGRPPE
ncbi:protein phosphatase 1 regulatory subunit 35 [Anser cygnoides]|uniref:protein phosphatase 1 regulatory subunit 35 n=1 Tax=Anser cygnoides TaxID=8845 RepID=UPI0034D2361F